jgi:RHS repeat-associated protein
MDLRPSLAFRGHGSPWSRERDAGGSLYYYRARTYDPDVGRFTGKDPAGMADGTSLYAYVGNNPVNFGDPSGLRKGKLGCDGGSDSGRSDTTGVSVAAQECQLDYECVIRRAVNTFGVIFSAWACGACIAGDIETLGAITPMCYVIFALLVAGFAFLLLDIQRGCCLPVTRALYVGGGGNAYVR